MASRFSRRTPSSAKAVADVRALELGIGRHPISHFESGRESEKQKFYFSRIIIGRMIVSDPNQTARSHLRKNISGICSGKTTSLTARDRLCLINTNQRSAVCRVVGG